MSISKHWNGIVEAEFGGVFGVIGKAFYAKYFLILRDNENFLRRCKLECHGIRMSTYFMIMIW
jgi:hypothetical protein